MKKERIEWESKGLDLGRIQDRLFYIGSTVADIFERHNIRYMLAFGTLLGAVRHEDMIPWDDDFDLMLFKEDYQKASIVLREELPEALFLEDSKNEPLYFHAWSHVKDLKSICINSLYPADDAYSHKGLHLDLYRFTKIRSSELDNYLKKENVEYIDRRKKYGLISEEDYNRRLSLSFSDYQLKNHNQDRDVYVFDGPYKQKTMEIDWVFPLKKYRLRNRLFYGPFNAHLVLQSIYGDYMKLPAIDYRKPKLDKVIFVD